MYSYIKKIAFTRVSFKREVEKKTFLKKKGCNNGVHVCLKSVKELRMLLFSTQNNFFSSIFFLLHASIASMQI